MNPYEELELKLLDKAQLEYNELKLKKLYTRHDIDSITNEYEDQISELKNKSHEDYNKLPEYDENFGWVFAAGIGVGFIAATILLTIIHNI